MYIVIYSQQMTMYFNKYWWIVELYKKRVNHLQNLLNNKVQNTLHLQNLCLDI